VSGTLAILGTGSEVGKSLVCTALLRLLRHRGILAAPFKAQNMSNNSAVTFEGGEIGRAQYTQARAAGLEPEVAMNPILVKPESDHHSQLVILGQAAGQLKGNRFFARNQELRELAFAAFDDLKSRFGRVIVEGAGSLAEVNLRDKDFINLGLAQAKGIPVLLLADIDRGGVFAQIVGSLEVLSVEDRSRIKGILINRFRGDRELFADGVRWIEERTGLPVLGLLPYVPHLHLPAEDAVALESLDPPMPPSGPSIAVLQFPRISNFTDFEPLGRVAGLKLHFLRYPRDLSPYSMVILPGSKSVLADLAWARELGWDEKILAYHGQGGVLLGVCGGFQMLGQDILDPQAIESEQEEGYGLGLVPILTRFEKPKTLKRRKATVAGVEVEGYEIHQGQSLFLERQRPWLSTEDGPEGWRDGQIWGTYLHGLFDHPRFLSLFLQESIGFHWSPNPGADPIDHLAKALEPHLDMVRIIEILEGD